jgi:diguanylate cyclase (GGDEF)-like protein/PAS domain S-box-containing protein
MRRYQVGYGVVGALAIAGYFVMPPSARWIGYELIGLSTVVAILVGIRRFRPARPTAWRLLAGGSALFVSGDVAWTIYELTTHRPPPVFSIADVLYLAAYPVLFLGGVSMARAAGVRGRSSAIHAAIAGTAGSMILWQLVLEPGLRANGYSMAALPMAIYPLADLAILSMLLTLLMTRDTRVPALWFVLVSFLLLLAADAVYTLIHLSPSKQIADLVDMLWLAAYVALGLAALDPSMTRLAERAPVNEWVGGRQVALLSVVLFVAPTLTIVRGVPGNEGAIAVSVGAMIIAVLVMLRIGAFTRELVAARYQANESEKRFRSIFAHSPSGLLVVDPSCRIVRANVTAEEMFGFSSGTLAGVSGTTLTTSEEDATRLSELYERLIAGELEDVRGQWRFRRHDGSTFWGGVTANVVRTDDGRAEHAIVIVEDATARHEHEERLRYRVLHDALTGLPNRELFADRLGLALDRSRRSGDRIAVLFLDLDGFKQVNDQLGHEAGDRLLQIVASRLSEGTRGHDSVARMGGDEFVILSEDARNPKDVEAMASRLLAALERPITLDGTVVRVDASVGVAISVGPDDRPEDLLRQADMAMYAAKEAGHGLVRRFDPVAMRALLSA